MKPEAVFAAFRVKLKQSTRYRGYWISDIVLTFFMAFLPILIGRGAGGTGIFAQLTGTTNYPGYMLLGACAFMVMDAPIWQMGNWFRREQQIGTLQSIYLAPQGPMEALTGIGLFTLFRSCIIAGIPLCTGFLWFHLELSGGVILALAFLLVGFIPVCGLSLMIGALILRLKETGAILNMTQMAFGLLMGMWCQVTLFPVAIRAISYCIPMTWINSGVRASIMDISYLLGPWQDFLVLLIFCVVMPLAGFLIFSVTERSVKRREGVNLF